MAGFAETCAQAGMDDYLIKPLEEDALMDALQRWLPGRAKSRGGVASMPIVEEAGLLDLARLRKMCRDNDAQVRETLELFLSSTESLLETLRQAVTDQDALLAARQAHQIRGAAVYLGAETMADQARATENAAKDLDWPLTGEALEDLEAAFIAVRLEIERRT